MLVISGLKYFLTYSCWILPWYCPLSLIWNNIFHYYRASNSKVIKTFIWMTQSHFAKVKIINLLFNRIVCLSTEAHALQITSKHWLWYWLPFCSYWESTIMFYPCYSQGFSQTYFPQGGCYNRPWIINTEGHITLNLPPVYRYGHLLSIDTKISTNH